ncbi:MAG: PTS sugar transporter subunit IIC [Calditrichaeota bacterium]|nr:PTS sugar transporter subunit IIC [Calditrichota bacterium]
MFQKYLILFLSGGIIGLDTTAAWQILISHPLISNTLIGWIFGDLPLGLFFGLAMEMIWLKDIPIGGAKLPEGNIGSFVGMSAILFAQPQNALHQPWLVFGGFLYAFLIAHLAGFTLPQMRRNNRILVKWADHFAKKGHASGVAWMHRIGILHAFFHGAVWTVVAVWVGAWGLDKLGNWTREWGQLTTVGLKSTLLGMGIGIVGYYYTSKKNRPILFAGVILGIVIGLLWG